MVVVVNGIDNLFAGWSGTKSSGSAKQSVLSWGEAVDLMGPELATELKVSVA